METKIIKGIVDSALNTNIKVKLSNVWLFDKDINTLEVKKEELNKDKGYILNIIYEIIAEGIYTEIPEDIVNKLDFKYINEHNLALSFFETLRIKRKMMFNYPGVRDYFEYGFVFNDNLIADSVIESTSKHIKFLYEVKKWYYGHGKTVLEKEIEKVINSENTSELIENFNELLLTYYLDLIEEKSEKETMEEEEEELKKQSEDKEEELEKKKKPLEIEEFEEEIETEIGELIQEIPEYLDKYKLVQSDIKKLVKLLKPILEENKYKRFKRNQDKGQIDVRNLYKLVTGESNIFKQKIKSKKDYGISILIDLSASMLGEKSEIAGLSIITLVEALEELGVRINIYGFNTRMYILKEGELDRQSLMKIFTEPSTLNGIENFDGYAINFVSARIKPQDYLIVLSDGEPTGQLKILNPEEVKRTGKVYAGDFDLKTEVKKSKNKIIGIGIQSEAVIKYYDKYFILDNISELPHKFTYLLKKIIG